MFCCVLSFPLRVLVFTISLSHASWADLPAKWTPRIIASPGGGCFFKMIPDIGKREGGKNFSPCQPAGVAYTLTENGSFRELWRVSGWYTYQGYISDDGRYFIRFGLWASDRDKQTDLAVAFYDGGKLLRQYQVRQLIRNKQALEESTSHYQWLPEVQTEPNGIRKGRFRLVLIDKGVCEFDLTTGKLVKRGVDPGAKSARDYYSGLRKAGKL